MTCRPLLWITATAVALGVAATPTPSGADEGWVVTVDEGPAVVESHSVVVAGDARVLGLALVQTVSVTMVAQTPLPDACGGPVTQTGPVTAEGRYEVTVEVVCNGPYEAQVVAHSAGFDSGSPETRAIGVAEKPAPPADGPKADRTANGLVLSWQPAAEADAAGWVLESGNGPVEQLSSQTTRRELSEEYLGQTLSLRALRWGAAGPDGEILASDYSPWVYVDDGDPNPDPDPDPNPDPEPPPPSSDPDPDPGPSGPGPSDTAAPPTTGRDAPTRGTGSPATLPDGYSEELPFGTPDKSFVPGQNRRSSGSDDDAEEGAASSATPSATGLVRTTEKRSPGLVAPFALGLLMITIAAHIAWYLRRSRPSGGGGQVNLR